MASLKTSTLILALITLLIFTFSEAEFKHKEIPVKIHENSWAIPLSVNILDGSLEEINCIVGDFLVWNFQNGKNESVLEVIKEDYDACTTSKPIQEYKDGNITKIELNREGPFYFISGADGHCEKGAKVEVFAEFYVHFYWRRREEWNKRYKIREF